MSAKKNKSPQVFKQPSTEKSPRISRDPDSYYDLNPAWKLDRLELCDPYGWHQLDRESIDRVRTRLVAFESMTWREILIDGRKRNHSVKTSDICTAVRKRLESIGLDDLDRLLSLGLTGPKERIWGILANGVMSLLWWDPGHEICPSSLKHT